MTQPTQELPPWLTASLTTITDPGGGIMTTTTVVFLPLTYYGPSIPLGTDGVWTWGGLTSPAPSEPPTIVTHSNEVPTTAATPPPSPPPPPPPSSSPPPPPPPSSPSPPSATTAIPPSSPSTVSPLPPSTTSIPTTPSASMTRPTSITSFSTSAGSPTSSPTAAHITASSLSKAAKIGLGVGAILGSVVLLLLMLLCLRWRTRRRADGYHTPIWTGWEIIPNSLNGRDRPRGEGTPRHSGEEADPFLQRRKEGQDMREVGSSSFSVTSRPRLVSQRSRPEAEAAMTAGGAGIGAGASQGGSVGSSSSMGSGYGTLLNPSQIGLAHGNPSWFADRESGSDRSTRTISQPPSSLGGHILSPSVLRSMTEASDRRNSAAATNSSSSKSKSSNSRTSRNLRHIPSIPEGYSPLIPPAPLNPDHISARVQRSAGSLFTETQRSSASEMPEVLTASRVRAEDLAPRSAPSSPAVTRNRALRTSWTGPLGGLSRWSQFSWFRNEHDSDRSSHSQSNVGARESGMFVTEPLTDQDVEAGQVMLRNSVTSRELGLNVDGSRPLSSVSARSGASGNTVYHDALEDFEQPPPVPPLPRAYLMGAGNENEAPRRSEAYQEVPTSDPPEYEDHRPQNGANDPTTEVDILDMPVPRPASPFSSSSNSSVRPLYPPGLGLPMPKAWRESAGWSSAENESAGITIEILEDPPPRAGEGWRSIASNVQDRTYGDAVGRRTTFGIPTVIHPQEPTMSEVGSLHSIRSRLSPMSARSTTSPTASSRRAFSSSIGSSAHSPRSQARSSSSAAVSLAHSGSISSDGRRRPRAGEGAISPATSALGRPIGGRRTSASVGDITNDTITPGMLFGGSGNVSPTTPSGWLEIGDDAGIRLVTAADRHKRTDHDVAETS